MIYTISTLLLLLFCKNLAFGDVINIFGINNGKGMENGRQILKKALEDLGHTVFEIESFNNRGEFEPQVDINIFLNSVEPECYSIARLNWFIPNQEHYWQPMDYLAGIDLILCRTREVERIFSALNKKTFFLGFRSRDCYREDVKKKRLKYLHVAGGSPHKGSSAVIKAWRFDKSMPNLTLLMHKKSSLSPFSPFQKNTKFISKRIPFDELLTLQNSCGIHLCPSEVEGYGHYLMEAMSTKAVVITTDAPPMNEFITDTRCLVPYVKTAPLNLGTNYYVDADILKKKVLELQALPKKELEQIGEKNREAYLQRCDEFYRNLKLLFQEHST